jgi:energy-coupling factor transporter ATP-binding protein EcfA2
MKPTHSISKNPKFANITNEQGRVAISPAKTLKVVAPAGSGKTTTMMAYASARPNTQGLYLAFGKPTQEEAQRKLTALGVKTVARTQHSLAYQQFGAPMKKAGKLEQRSGLRAAVTAHLLGVNYPTASAINATLTNFLSDPVAEVTEDHLPSEEEHGVIKTREGTIIEGARLLWQRMTSLSDVEAQAVDDVYLKQWVMTNPVLPYQFILYDECQDSNKLTAHLVNNQKHCTRVYVGDPHQAIYGFRGAVNLMDSLEAEANMRLSMSFRFTPNIALLASTYLKHWKKSQHPIIGKGAGGPILKTDQTAFLARTVAGLIDKGFELHSKGAKLHWVKGFEDYRVAPILEAYSLFSGNRGEIRDPVLKLMGSWEQLGDYVESTRDGELRPVYKLIENYRHDIPSIIQELKLHQVRKESEAQFVLTTGHKSKGLEWPVVRLIDDFFSFKDDKGVWNSPDEIDEQEANLMYVMLTRAQKAIAPTKEVAEWFSSQPETKHLFPTKPAEAPQQKEERTESEQPA